MPNRRRAKMAIAVVRSVRCTMTIAVCVSVLWLHVSNQSEREIEHLESRWRLLIYWRQSLEKLGRRTSLL